MSRLVALLFEGADEEGDTPAAIARRSGLGHETIRRLWRHPGSRDRSGPGFFVVAAIARARGVSLDYLADETLNLPGDKARRG